MLFRRFSRLNALTLLHCIFNLFADVSAASFESKCNDFAKSINIPQVTVNFVEYVAGKSAPRNGYTTVKGGEDGSNLSFAHNDPTCNRPYQVTYGGDLCRVAMYVATSKASGITLEAWLPSNWTGRFLSTGNGGISGCIQYEDIAYGSSFGFATVGANNGHNGTSGKAFYNAPGVVEDFAWRSMHTGVVVGKQLTELFYQKNFTKSYYLGCSTGGRQGMKSAQMFPDDFDGIVAGAPAFDFNDLTSWSGWLGVITGFDNTSSGFVSESLWSVVHDEILSQCDGIDGAVDGIIEDPDLCRPIFSSLVCASSTSNKSTCLNGEQATRVAGIFTDFYGINGTLVFPRLQPGAELAAFPFYLAGTPFPYTTDWFRYAVYNNPSWNPEKLSLTDVAYAAKLNLFNISSYDADLYDFKNKGGKILTYQGMQDQIITSDNSERYYKKLSNTMNLPPSDLDAFYRYFRISGMGHCAGGPGAWNIGQRYSGDSKSFEAEDNILLAMVQWVEKGVAPEFVRGTKYVNDTAADGVEFRRRHCKFPARNVYVGPGKYTDEKAWKCVLDLGSISTQ